MSFGMSRAFGHGESVVSGQWQEAFVVLGSSFLLAVEPRHKNQEPRTKNQELLLPHRSLLSNRQPAVGEQDFQIGQSAGAVGGCFCLQEWSPVHSLAGDPPVIDVLPN